MEKTPTLCQQEGKASVGGPKVFKMVTRKALKNAILSGYVLESRNLWE